MKGMDFKLMFELVLNHVSAKSRWFQNYLSGKHGFEDLAIEVDPAADLSRVARPRSLPLLTEFNKSCGKTVHVWTTFSADQVDLNYKSLNVLGRMVEVLLYYVKQGAAAIRLDALLSGRTGADPYHPQRFLATQAIQYALPGVPAMYIHSILGSRNWETGVRQTRRARTINRERMQVDQLLSQLNNPATLRSQGIATIRPYTP